MRILGGLMALGYEIGSILKRTSRVWQDDQLMIKIDEIDGMEHKFVQVGLGPCNGQLPKNVHEQRAAKNLYRLELGFSRCRCLQVTRWLQAPKSDAENSCLRCGL